jgi:hypothetical protein
MIPQLKSYLGHSYPAQLAEMVKKAWPRESLARLPQEHHLRQLIDIAYHASFLRDEDRQVRFRLIFGDPSFFPPEDGPPSGLMPLTLDPSRPFDEQEIRKLAMAALFFRSMIGVCPAADQNLHIWGVVVSGTRWLSSLAGGRYRGPLVPDSLILHSLGPGHLTTHLGARRIATLSGGRIESQAFDLFHSRWLHQHFSEVRHNVLTDVFGQASDVEKIPVDVDFVRMMSYNILLRTLSVVRNGRHGGTLIILDPRDEPQLTATDKAIRFKYRIADCPARRRYDALLKSAVARLSELSALQNNKKMGWTEYQNLSDGRLGDLDEALFDFAHFLADLMAVDGALVVTHGFRLVGFGAELRVDPPGFQQVRHGLDAEGQIWTNESIEGVGTRHRAVYRFCEGYPRALGVVVSQDGSVQVVRKHHGRVTFWNQLSW